MKEKLKVYHGLPKTPLIEDTVLYASFDGSTTPEISGEVTVRNKDLTFSPNVCGYGLISPTYSTTSSFEVNFSKSFIKKLYTVDFWVDCSRITFDEMSSISNGYEHYGLYVISNDNTTADIRVFAYHYHSTKKEYSNCVRIYAKDKNYDVYVPMRSGMNHFRIIRDDSKVIIYVNGNLYHENTYTFSDEQKEQTVDGIRIYKLRASICDLRVVHANLGDCFPTLPQDFIDGKAIVVPALNQRQSYGDPVLHQVTELLVPATTDSQNYYSHHTTDDSSLWQHDTHPELSVAHADSWVNGAIIRITGLDQAPITGVFDTDTAKCRIIEEVRNTTKVPVNSVSGISVGDTLVYVYSSDFRVFNLTYTVQAVDSVNNIITLDSNSNLYAGDYFFETTVSSSSPVVKTVEGATVNGTWSGLGTNVATFTLGSNSNIAGKDLVVTYCLNAKGNSSPYPKMPSEVIRGYNELGDTMFPTDNIILTDNFTSKITGDLSSCPHSLKYFCASSTLKSPKDTNWVEFSQHQYNALSNNQEVSIATATNNMIPQILVEWDLVELIERKFGGTIPGNKINWINDNVSKVQCYAICRGENGETYKSTLSYYNSSSWSTNSSGATITSPEFKQLKCLVSNENGNIYKTTNFYCLLYPDSVRNSNTSRIILKDIYFEIIFKTDTRFDYLFPENPLSKCNPILIDKQTKEVKRLLPSTAPFSTEVLVHNPTTMSTPTTTLIKGTDNVMTTLGSGSSCNEYDVMRGLVGKLGMESHLYTNDTLNKLTYYSVSDHDQRTKIVPRQYYLHNYAKNEIADEDVPKDMSLLAVAYDLVVTDSKEVAMKTLCHVIENGKRTEYITHTYVLPNRPLIK